MEGTQLVGKRVDSYEFGPILRISYVYDVNLAETFKSLTQTMTTYNI